MSYASEQDELPDDDYEDDADDAEVEVVPFAAIANELIAPFAKIGAQLTEIQIQLAALMEGKERNSQSVDALTERARKLNAPDSPEITGMKKALFARLHQMGEEGMK